MVYGTQESLPEIRLEIFYGRPVELNHKELLPKINFYFNIYTYLKRKSKNPYVFCVNIWLFKVTLKTLMKEAGGWCNIILLRMSIHHENWYYMSQKIVRRNETPLQSFNFFKRIFSRIFFISSALICCFCMFLFRFLAFARNNLSKIFQSLFLFYYDMWVAVDFNIQMSILSSIIHESLRRCVQFNVINRVNAPISFNISSSKRHS